MGLIDVCILVVIGLILGGAGWFIGASKKKGKTCIGCPDNCACAHRNCSGGCSGCSEKK